MTIGMLWWKRSREQQAARLRAEAEAMIQQAHAMRRQAVRLEAAADERTREAARLEAQP